MSVSYPVDNLCYSSGHCCSTHISFIKHDAILGLIECGKRSVFLKKTISQVSVLGLAPQGMAKGMSGFETTLSCRKFSLLSDKLT